MDSLWKYTELIIDSLWNYSELIMDLLWLASNTKTGFWNLKLSFKCEIHCGYICIIFTSSIVLTYLCVSWGEKLEYYHGWQSVHFIQCGKLPQNGHLYLLSQHIFFQEEMITWFKEVNACIHLKAVHLICIKEINFMQWIQISLVYFACQIIFWNQVKFYCVQL